MERTLSTNHVLHKAILSQSQRDIMMRNTLDNRMSASANFTLTGALAANSDVFQAFPRPRPSHHAFGWVKEFESISRWQFLTERTSCRSYSRQLLAAPMAPAVGEDVKLVSWSHVLMQMAAEQPFLIVTLHARLIWGFLNNTTGHRKLSEMDRHWIIGILKPMRLGYLQTWGTPIKHCSLGNLYSV